ncbi:MAG TPA: GWxTD domain-containing protein, partial [Thermoanaerobaculia bacterium]|nr:GWxTD domain-containing protein [Thermoanaerobaculia bacterium]
MPLVRSIPWILAAALVAAPALSELSAPLRDWAAGPVSFLFTDAERAAWAELSSDDEAERFRRLFWARRDPLPETPENEALREFEGRVAAADERFGDDDRRGALTDRGRVLVVLGPPN